MEWTPEPFTAGVSEHLWDDFALYDTLLELDTTPNADPSPAPTPQHTSSTSAQKKLYRVRERNRLSQARYRHRLKEETKRLKDDISRVEVELVSARAAHNQRKTVNEELSNRLGTATQCLLELESQHAVHHPSTHVPVPVQSPVTYGVVESSQQSSAPASLSAKVVVDGLPAGCEVPIEKSQHSWQRENSTVHMDGEQHIPFVVATQRSVLTFSNRCALEPSAALSSVQVDHELQVPCKALHSATQHTAGGSDLALPGACIKEFSKALDAHLECSASALGAHPQNVLWFVQTPLNVAAGTPLTFSTSISSLSCCSSMLMTILALHLDAVFLSELLREVRGGECPESIQRVSCAASGQSRLAHGSNAQMITGGGMSTSEVLRMLDGVLARSDTPAAGVEGTCGVGDGFMLSSGVDYVCRNICSQYKAAMSPQAWTEAVCVFATWVQRQHVLLEQCRKSCMVALAFRWSGRDGREVRPPSAVCCPKSNILPYVAATIRSELRNGLDQFNLPPQAGIPPPLERAACSSSPSVLHASHHRSHGQTRHVWCATDATNVTQVEASSSRHRASIHTEPSLEGIGVSTHKHKHLQVLMTRAARLHSAVAVAMRQGMSDAPAFFRRMRLFTTPPNVNFSKVEEYSNSMFKALAMSEEQVKLVAGLWRLWRRRRKELDTRFQRALFSLCRLLPEHASPFTSQEYLVSCALGTKDASQVACHSADATEPCNHSSRISLGEHRHTSPPMPLTQTDVGHASACDHIQRNVAPKSGQAGSHGLKLSRVRNGAPLDGEELKASVASASGARCAALPLHGAAAFGPHPLGLEAASGALLGPSPVASAGQSGIHELSDHLSPLSGTPTPQTSADCTGHPSDDYSFGSAARQCKCDGRRHSELVRESGGVQVMHLCPCCGYTSNIVLPKQGSTFGELGVIASLAQAQQALRDLHCVQAEDGQLQADFLGALTAPGCVFTTEQLVKCSQTSITYAIALPDLLRVCERAASLLQRQMLMAPFSTSAAPGMFVPVPV